MAAGLLLVRPPGLETAQNLVQCLYLAATASFVPVGKHVADVACTRGPAHPSPA